MAVNRTLDAAVLAGELTAVMHDTDAVNLLGWL
jgi:hypothetical protein